MTERRERFLDRLKCLLDEGRFFCLDDAWGVAVYLRTDEEMDLMEQFLDEHPQATQDEILMRMLEIYEQYHDD